MSKGDARVTLRLPPALIERAEAKADGSEYGSRSQVIRDAIDVFLNTEGEAAFRQAMLACDSPAARACIETAMHMERSEFDPVTTQAAVPGMKLGGGDD